MRYDSLSVQNFENSAFGQRDETTGLGIGRQLGLTLLGLLAPVLLSSVPTSDLAFIWWIPFGMHMFTKLAVSTICPSLFRDQCLDRPSRTRALWITVKLFLDEIICVGALFLFGHFCEIST